MKEMKQKKSGHIARMGERRDKFNRETKGKRSLTRPGRRWEENTNIDQK
jgi:hypothetical protein